MRNWKDGLVEVVESYSCFGDVWVNIFEEVEKVENLAYGLGEIEKAEMVIIIEVLG